MNLKHFHLHPLIPLRTPHLTLTSLDKAWENEESLLASGTLPLPTPEDGLRPDTLLLRVVVTAEQRTIGFAQLGSVLYCRSLAHPFCSDYRKELLNALLSFSFLVLNRTAVQLLNQPDNLLIEAYTPEDPKALVQIASGTMALFYYHTRQLINERSHPGSCQEVKLFLEKPQLVL